MAANANLSPKPPVKAVDFKGKLEVSHQEDLVNAAGNTSQKVNSCHSDEPPGDVPRTPKSDGYSWRKYGQKQVKGSGSSRSYYRCTSVSCYAKKKVQHVDLSGEIIDVVYKGDHNHDPPQHVRGTIRKKDLTQGVLQNSRDSFAQNHDVPLFLSSYGELKQLVPQAGTSPKHVEEQPSETIDTFSRPESELPVVPAVKEHSGLRSTNSNELAMIDPMKVPEVAPFKKRRIKERGKACSESVYRTFKDPKVVVLADTDAVVSSDGYRWRKYGQKMVKGTPHPRSYYRCSSVGCPVRKHVERTTENSGAILVTYEGEHDHDIPTPKRHHHLALPNPTTFGVNMVLEKTESKSSSQISVEEQYKDLDSNLKEDQKGSETGGDKVLESARTLLSIGDELKSY